MPEPVVTISVAVLFPLSLLIGVYDVRYRRIPNLFVLAVLASGFAINGLWRGWDGVADSLQGCLLAFGLMFGVRLLTGLGAGDVKLFAAIGALVGGRNVLPAFVLVVLVGGVLAAAAMLKAGVARSTLLGVIRIFAGLLPGGQVPARAEFARSGLTIPYGIAVTGGSLLQMLSVWLGN